MHDFYCPLLIILTAAVMDTFEKIAVKLQESKQGKGQVQ
jgi:hypothetical protein